MSTKDITDALQAQDSALRVIHSSAKPFMKRLIRWICPEQRFANRYVSPPLIAYLGPVRGSCKFRIGDFSIGGFYMVTEERWVTGTSFPITFERTDPDGNGRTLTVNATVVRDGKDGVGFSFVPPSEEEYGNETANQPSMVVDLTKLAEFLTGLPLARPTEEPLRQAS